MKEYNVRIHVEGYDEETGEMDDQFIGAWSFAKWKDALSHAHALRDIADTLEAEFSSEEE